MASAESSSSSAAPKPNLGIISIGQMGAGIGELLHAHGYSVFTCAQGGSQSTLDRIKSAHITNLPSDEDLVVQADVILSIVPPRDAIATARRIIEACKKQDAVTKRSEKFQTETPSLTYVDLNAISPWTAKTIATLIATEAPPDTSLHTQSTNRRASSFSFLSVTDRNEPSTTTPIAIHFLDGGILGAAPILQTQTDDDPNTPSTSTTTTNKNNNKNNKTWQKPSIFISGPLLPSTQLPHHLSTTLNLQHISPAVGPASALKACFAALNKGLTALELLAFSTASTAGVLEHLQTSLSQFSPALANHASRSLTQFPPKADRWVEEMRQIGETLADEGGFGDGLGGKAVFEGFSDVFRLVAEETEMGREREGKMARMVEDVCKGVEEGLRKRRRKGVGGGDEDLNLTWRSSWS